MALQTTFKYPNIDYQLFDFFLTYFLVNYTSFLTFLHFLAARWVNGQEIKLIKDTKLSNEYLNNLNEINKKAVYQYMRIVQLEWTK
jgi:hypothetical protein